MLFGYEIFVFLVFPAIRYYQRDQNFDFHNVVSEGELLTLRLLHSDRKSLKNYFVLYENSSVPYTKTKYVFSGNITIPVTKLMAENKTNHFIIFQVWQNKPKDKYFYLNSTIYHQLINWKKLGSSEAHKLLNNNSTAHKKKSDTWAPIVYRVQRFDVVAFGEIFNPTTSLIGIGDMKLYKSQKLFKPIVQYDEFYDIKSEMRRVNLTQGNNITLKAEIYIRDPHSWRIKESIVETVHYVRQISAFDGIADVVEKTLSDIKNMFIDANPILLWSTAIATVLHFIFQTLAFESDMKFWVHKKTFRGVSLRSLLLSLLFDLSHLIYVLDSDTPTYLRIISGASVLKEFWKISKLLELHLRWPFVRIKKSYKGESSDADSDSMKLIYFLVVPLIVGFWIYQLLFSEFTSFKRYIIYNLATTAYAFSFLNMLPQLYVNYRLKTVAGMSAGALAYKFVDTIIDDLMTFAMRMPLTMKIACFRDDVVFVIWLVQWMMYGVDPKRPNEYGLVLKGVIEEEEEEIKEEEAEEGSVNVNEEINEDGIERRIANKLE